MKLKYKGTFWRNIDKGFVEVPNNFVTEVQLRKRSTNCFIVSIDLDNNTSSLTATGGGPKDQQGIHLEYEKSGEKFDCYLEVRGFDSSEYSMIWERVKRGYELYFIKRGRETLVQGKSFRIRK